MTVYGVADATYVYTKAADQKRSYMEDGGFNGSRIGFRGEEALGNGLKAVFNVTMGFRVDRNSSFDRTRHSWVGLAGNFGAVTLGRHEVAPVGWLGDTTSNGLTTVYPANTGHGNAFSLMNTGVRWDNAFQYESPNVSGFQARVIYALGEQVRDSFSDATTDGSSYGLGVRYANGPIYATLMYNARNESASGVDDDAKAWAIGGAYDFKVVRVAANYIEQKDGDEKKRFLISLGVSVPVGKAGTVRAEIMQFKDKRVQDNKASGFGIGYDYDLSKRTRIYTAISRINNDDGVYYGNGNVAAIGENNTNFAFGIRHSF